MNLADVRAFALRGAATVEGVWGGSCTIGGTVYPCALGQPPVQGSFEPGGEILTGELLIQIRKDALATCPPRGTRVTARGAIWVIRRTAGDGPADAAWSLHCEPHN